MSLESGHARQGWLLWAVTLVVGVGGCAVDSGPAGDAGQEEADAAVADDGNATDGADLSGDGDGSQGDSADAADGGGAVGDPGPGGAWIGEPCALDGDCGYDAAFCVLAGYPDGMCSLECQRLCSDADEPGHAITFCIEDPDRAGQGMCVSRCDPALYPSDGCRAGYACLSRPRFGEPGTLQPVCLPGDDPEHCTGDEVPQPNAGIDEPAGLGGCPAGMLPIGPNGVCIDAWEAFLVEVADDGSVRPHSPYFPPTGLRVRARSAPGAVPQGYIDELQAQAACLEAGKRLCTRAEWERACQGPQGWTYPYGPDRIDGACNDARAQHPAIEYFGTSADWIWSELGHPCLNQLPDSLAPAGSHPECVSPDGAFDMMGNLHEWIDDPAGTFKGGYYVDTRINGEGCLYTTTAHNVSHWDYSTGFRCCASLR